MEENNKTGKIFLKDKNNEYIELGEPTIIDDISMIGEASKENHNPIKEAYIEVGKKYPLEFSCTISHITRKRFIKVLMGECIAKKEAEKYANKIFNTYGFYSYLFM